MSADGERHEAGGAATHSGTDAGQSKIQNVYKVGFGRWLILWIVFLLLLPFFISMPVMFGMRILHGKFVDAASLGLMAVLLGVALAFLYLQIKAARRTRIELDENEVKLTVPTWRGPTPFGPFIEEKISYSDIDCVEQRGELYRMMGVVGLRKASCVVTKDGKRIVLGYETEQEDDEPIPFSRIASEVASNAAVSLVNKGAVNVGTQFGAAFGGTPSWDTPPITAKEAGEAQKRARQIFVGMIGGFIILVIIAIVLSFLPQIQELFAAEG